VPDGDASKKKFLAQRFERALTRQRMTQRHAVTDS
jgi:hypothetical protein